MLYYIKSILLFLALFCTSAAHAQRLLFESGDYCDTASSDPPVREPGPYNSNITSAGEPASPDTTFYYDCYLANSGFEWGYNGEAGFWHYAKFKSTQISSNCEEITFSGSQANQLATSDTTGPFSGNVYYTLATQRFGSNQNTIKADYLQQKLQLPLQAGKRYVGWYYVRVNGIRDMSSAAWHTSALGMYFSNDLPTSKKVTVTGDGDYLVGKVQIAPPRRSYISNYVRWRPVFGMFTPTEQLNYLTVGKFLDPSVFTDSVITNRYQFAGYETRVGIPTGVAGPADITHDLDELGVMELPRAGSDTVLGCNESVQLGWVDTRPCSGSLENWSFSWVPKAGLDDHRKLFTLATPTRSTMYRLTVTLPDGQQYRDSVFIQVIGNEEAYTQPQITASCGDQFVLGTGCESQGAIYIWTPAAGLSDPTSLHPTLIVAKSQTYSLFIRVPGQPDRTSIVDVVLTGGEKIAARIAIECNKTNNPADDQIRLVPPYGLAAWYSVAELQPPSGSPYTVGPTFTPSAQSVDGRYNLKYRLGGSNGCVLNMSFYLLTANNRSGNLRTNTTYHNADLFVFEDMLELKDVVLSGTTRLAYRGDAEVVDSATCQPKINITGSIITQGSFLTLKDSVRLFGFCGRMWKGITIPRSTTLNTHDCVDCRIEDAETGVLYQRLDSSHAKDRSVENVTFTDCLRGIECVSSQNAPSYGALTVSGCSFISGRSPLKYPYDGSMFSRNDQLCPQDSLPIGYFYHYQPETAIKRAFTVGKTTVTGCVIENYLVGIQAGRSRAEVDLSSNLLSGIKLCGLGLTQVSAPQLYTNDIGLAYDPYGLEKYQARKLANALLLSDEDAAQGRGLYLYACPDAYVSANNFTGKAKGIGLHSHGSPAALITDNIFERLSKGLYASKPDSFVLERNTFTRVDSGVYFAYTHDLAPTLTSNTFNIFKAAITYNYSVAHNFGRTGNLLLGRLGCNVFDINYRRFTSNDTVASCVFIKRLAKQGVFSKTDSLDGRNKTAAPLGRSTEEAPCGNVFPTGSQDYQVIDLDTYTFYDSPLGYEYINNPSAYIFYYWAYGNEPIRQARYTNLGSKVQIRYRKNHWITNTGSFEAPILPSLIGNDPPDIDTGCSEVPWPYVLFPVVRL